MFFQKDVAVALKQEVKKGVIVALSFFSILLFSTNCLAAIEQLATQVKVEGNQRIETETVLTHMGVENVDSLTPQEEDAIVKNLFASGLFTDVSLRREGVQIVITVRENPVINRIIFEGTDKISDETLSQEIQLKPRTVYTKAKLQSDTNRILGLYNQMGRSSATVNTKVVDLDQNRVDIIFQIQEGKTTSIEKIVFVGNKVYSSPRLLEEIRTTEAAWWRFLSKTDTVDEDRFELDRELLRRFYHSHGYADAEVKSVTTELSPEGEGFIVTYTLFEGEKYDFGAVTLENQIKDLDSEYLLYEIFIRKGQTYDGTAIEKIVQHLTNRVTKEGFAFVAVKPGLKRDPECKTIDVVFVVEEGPRVYVERIDILGNVRTKDEVIRREFSLVEGDPFNSARLKRSEQRVRGLDYFKTVDVKVKPGSAPDRAVITVEVEEKSTGSLDFGAGFSTQDGPLGNIKLTERNLLGTGRILNLQSFISQRRIDADVSFTEPYFLDRRLAATIGAFYKTIDREKESNFKKQTAGGNVSFGFRYNEHVSEVWSYIYQQDDIFDVPSNASILIKQQEGKTDRSMITKTLMIEDLDNRAMPTEGWFTKWIIEGAGLGGDVTFLRNTLRGGYYLPLFDDVIASAKLEGGIIGGLGQIVRITDSFFVGGPASLRGFRRGSIGPKDIATNNFLGGKEFFTGTVDVSFPLGLPEELGINGIVFTDFGTLRKVGDPGVTPTIVDDPIIRSAVGIGLQWRSPLGPLEVGAALPTSKAATDVTEEFYINFGMRF